MDAPVDAQAVLLLLHAPLALAAVQLAGEKGRHGVPALAFGIRTQLVGPVPGNALPKGPELGAATRVVGAGFPSLQAVPSGADHVHHAFWGRKKKKRDVYAGNSQIVMFSADKLFFRIVWEVVQTTARRR